MKNEVSLYAEILNEDEFPTFQLYATAENLVADMQDYIQEHPEVIPRELVEFGEGVFNSVAHQYEKLYKQAGNYHPDYTPELPEPYRARQLRLIRQAQQLMKKLPIEVVCCLYNVCEWSEPDSLQWYITLDNGERVPIDTMPDKK